MNPSATVLMLMQTANVRFVPPIPAMSTRPFLADYRLMSEDRRRTGALDPNRPDTSDRYWGVCYILLRRRRVQFPSNRYLQGCRDRLNGRPPSMS